MKLSTYENPISGNKGNLFNIGDIWSQILGVLVLVFVWFAGNWIVDYLFPRSAVEEKQYQAIPKTRIIL